MQVAFSLSELEAAGGEVKEKWFTLKPADKEPGGLPCLGDTGWLRSGFSLPQLLAREGSGGADGPRLRLRLRLGREVLRPAEMYADLLREACVAPACVTAVLEACPQAQRDSIAEGLLHATNAQGSLPALLTKLVEQEVASAGGDPTLLFRGNSGVTKLLESFCTLVGSAYRRATLGPLIELVGRGYRACEVHPSRCTPTLYMDAIPNYKLTLGENLQTYKPSVPIGTRLHTP